MLPPWFARLATRWRARSIAGDVVIDASFMVALVLEEQYSEAARRSMDQWIDEGTMLHAPLLAQYEIATVLTRRRTKKSLSKAGSDEALEILTERLHLPHHPGQRSCNRAGGDDETVQGL